MKLKKTSMSVIVGRHNPRSRYPSLSVTLRQGDMLEYIVPKSQVAELLSACASLLVPDPIPGDKFNGNVRNRWMYVICRWEHLIRGSRGRAGAWIHIGVEKPYRTISHKLSRKELTGLVKGLVHLL